MASEVERIGEECRRYAERMVVRMAAAKAEREARDRQRTEQAAAEMRQLSQDAVERETADEGRADDRPLMSDEPGSPGNKFPARSEPESGQETFRLRESEIQRLRNDELRRQHQVITPAAGAGVPAQRPDATGLPVQPAHADDLDPREAIARAAAARRRNSVVAPIDDDGDDEAEYYQRKSWLV